MGAMRRPFYTLNGRMYSHTPVMTGLLSCTSRYMLDALAGGDRRRCGISAVGGQYDTGPVKHGQYIAGAKPTEPPFSQDLYALPTPTLQTLT